MSKKIPSKLDQFAEALAQMDSEKKSLSEMQAWLKDEGVVVTLSTISRFLESQRQTLLQESLLARIASGAQTCEDVEKAFAKNPAPGLETISKLLRVFVMQLSTQANVSPELFELVTPLMKSLTDFAKLELATKEFGLAKDKFQVEACEFFLRWFNDKRAQEIATSTMSNAEKIATLRREYFKDVDALQQSGKVVLPE